VFAFFGQRGGVGIDSTYDVEGIVCQDLANTPRQGWVGGEQVNDHRVAGNNTGSFQALGAEADQFHGADLMTSPAALSPEIPQRPYRSWLEIDHEKLWIWTGGN
jgi:hypothetical protein